MRRAAKVDDNQAEIVAAFRRMGCSVAITSAVGDGFPDLVVGYRRHNLLVEVKDGSKPPSKQRLTDDQMKFHGNWRGPVYVVKDVGDAAALINAVVEIERSA